MKLRAFVEYKTRGGHVRRIRLYQTWGNMRDRCAGHHYAGNGVRVWKGVVIEWKVFADFRAWALLNGFSRIRNSLDRIDPYGNYGPDNCRFVTVSENSSWQQICKFIREQEIEEYGCIKLPDYARRFADIGTV
jgi:hypothetical protein